jgi:hypothetical protein
MNSRLLALTCVAAVGLAGCGGGGDSTTAAPKPAAKAGPSIAEVVAIAKKNKGFAGCKEVAPGAPLETPAPTDPKTIQPLLCDGLQVTDYWVWGSEAEATAKTKRDDRPSFVNGKVVVTTGEALLAKQYDSAKAMTLPQEIKAACGCGMVVTP